MKKALLKIDYKWLALALIWLIAFPVLGQEGDFQTWGDISARYKLNKKWRMDAELGLRTRENSTMFKQYYLEYGIKYKINKRFDVSTKYRFTEYSKAGKTSIHRWAADLSYDNKIKRFRWSIRGRYQHQWFVSNYSQKYYEQTWRTKFSVNYNIRKCKLNPFTSLEHFMDLKGENRFETTAFRWSIGADYPVNKWSDISVSYKIEREWYTANPLTEYIFAVSYKIKLN